MSRTICFYQHPQALHEVDAWRAQMASRLSLAGQVESGGTPATIYNIACFDGTEEFYLVPLEFERVVYHRWRELSAENWDKVLYFGKIMGTEAVVLISTAMGVDRPVP